MVDLETPLVAWILPDQKRERSRLERIFAAHASTSRDWTAPERRKESSRADRTG